MDRLKWPERFLAAVLALIILSGVFFWSAATPFSRPVPAAQAQDDLKPLEFKRQIGLPIAPFNQDSVAVGKYEAGYLKSDLLARYIKAIYDYGLAVAGILAALVLMGGGIAWLTSGGNESRITKAKGLIAGSIIGLTLLSFSWILLNTVNPRLMELKVLSVQVRERKSLNFGCCQKADGAYNTTQEECGSSNKFVEGKLITKEGRDTKCDDAETSGCCVAVKTLSGNNTSQTSVTCTQSAKSICKNSPGVQTSFKEGQCASIESCQDSTAKVISCDGKEPGASCGEGYCYNNICHYGDGIIDSPCGNEPFSKCVLDEKDPATGFCDGDGGGRSCTGSNVWCCRHREDGTRINKGL